MCFEPQCNIYVYVYKYKISNILFSELDSTCVECGIDFRWVQHLEKIWLQWRTFSKLGAFPIHSERFRIQLATELASAGLPK